MRRLQKTFPFLKLLGLLYSNFIDLVFVEDLSMDEVASLWNVAYFMMCNPCLLELYSLVAIQFESNFQCTSEFYTLESK